ncbi:hypothetical protein [Orrella marina]|uniref:Uncharacterized protein n=1 Tax=Orrella marina TaxID=2163011 RepID=A0A2R4XH10_9BURK|nr:hypothetical protein [Orrella marina]AWB32983.1 hypothetical protein DBV39_03790 [Orrella marina]
MSDIVSTPRQDKAVLSEKCLIHQFFIGNSVDFIVYGDFLTRKVKVADLLTSGPGCPLSGVSEAFEPLLVSATEDHGGLPASD